jgi:hypothetical protein
MMAMGSTVNPGEVGWRLEGEFNRDVGVAEPAAGGTTSPGRSDLPDIMSVPAFPVSSMALDGTNERIRAS